MHTDAPWQCHINLQVDSYGLAQPDLKGAAVPAGGGARPGLEGPRLVMRDALHLFSPGRATTTCWPRRGPPAHPQVGSSPALRSKITSQECAFLLGVGAAQTITCAQTPHKAML